jgi:hypothetical protein
MMVELSSLLFSLADYFDEIGNIPEETCLAYWGQSEWSKKSSTMKITQSRDRPCARSSVSWLNMHFSPEEHTAKGPRQVFAFNSLESNFRKTGRTLVWNILVCFKSFQTSVTKIVTCRSDEMSVAYLLAKLWHTWQQAQLKTPLRMYPFVSSDETASTSICSRTAPKPNL